MLASRLVHFISDHEGCSRGLQLHGEFLRFGQEFPTVGYDQTITLLNPDENRHYPSSCQGKNDRSHPSLDSTSLNDLFRHQSIGQLRGLLFDRTSLEDADLNAFRLRLAQSFPAHCVRWADLQLVSAQNRNLGPAGLADTHEAG